MSVTGNKHTWTSLPMCQSLYVGCVLRNKIIGSEGICDFNIAKYFQVGLQSSRTSSCSHRQCGRVLVSPLLSSPWYFNLTVLPFGLSFFFTCPMFLVSLIIFSFARWPYRLPPICELFVYILCLFFHIVFLICKFSTYYGYYPLLICFGNNFLQSVIYILTLLLWLPQGLRCFLLSKMFKDLHFIFSTWFCFDFCVSTLYHWIYCFSMWHLLLW